jgi:hypothetical protein
MPTFRPLRLQAPSLRAAILLVAALAAAACNQGSEHSAAGEVEGGAATGGGVGSEDAVLEPSGRLRYEVRSERYRLWDIAQRSLAGMRDARLSSVIDTRRPTTKSIDRAVAYLQRNERARSAIEQTGLSVREYVLLSIAIDQQTSGVFGRPRATTAPTPPSAVAPPPTPGAAGDSMTPRQHPEPTPPDSAELPGSTTPPARPGSGKRRTRPDTMRSTPARPDSQPATRETPPPAPPTPPPSSDAATSPY